MVPLSTLFNNFWYQYVSMVYCFEECYFNKSPCGLCLMIQETVLTSHLVWCSSGSIHHQAIPIGIGFIHVVDEVNKCPYTGTFKSADWRTCQGQHSGNPSLFAFLSGLYSNFFQLCMLLWGIFLLINYYHKTLLCQPLGFLTSSSCYFSYGMLSLVYLMR